MGALGVFPHKGCRRMLIFPPRELFNIVLFLLAILVRTFAGKTVEISSVLRGGELEEEEER